MTINDLPGLIGSPDDVAKALSIRSDKILQLNRLRVTVARRAQVAEHVVPRAWSLISTTAQVQEAKRWLSRRAVTYDTAWLAREITAQAQRTWGRVSVPAEYQDNLSGGHPSYTAVYVAYGSATRGDIIVTEYALPLSRYRARARGGVVYLVKLTLPQPYDTPVNLIKPTPPQRHVIAVLDRLGHLSWGRDGQLMQLMTL